jgi:hypothetical protein
MDKIPVIYITSLGRSGSTLLDLMIGRHSLVESVGEIDAFDQWVDSNLLCSCQETMADCSYWNEIRQNLPGNEAFRIGYLSKAQRTKSLVLKPSSQEAKAYSLPNHHLFSSILKNTSKKIILDSSKRVQRLRYLISSDLFDLKVIHLVRNGNAVVNSYKRASERPEFTSGKTTVPGSPLQTSTRWVLYNLLAQKLGRHLGPERYIRVRYEDVALRPEEEVRKICSRFGLTYEEGLLNPTTQSIHNISGSRWRFKSEQKVEVKIDERWRRELSQRDKLTFAVVGGLLNRAYGFSND